MKDDYEGIYCALPLTNYEDKDTLIRYHIVKEFRTCMQMFHYGNLPETIKERDLKMLLMRSGYGIAIERNKNLYILKGSLGGKPNQNYMPTLAIVANPYLDFSDTFEIDKNCVVLRNDSTYSGLLPIFTYHAIMNTECVISRRIATINLRMMNIPVANDGNTAESFKKLFQDLEKGKISSMTDKNMLKDVTMLPWQGTSSANTMTQLIENEQYSKASFYNDVGLNANYNMKREAINADESQLNVDALFPLCDDMYETQKADIEKINAMFGTNITIEFTSSWKRLREQAENSIKTIEQTLQSNDETDKEDEEKEEKNEDNKT